MIAENTFLLVARQQDTTEQWRVECVGIPGRVDIAMQLNVVGGWRK